MAKQRQRAENGNEFVHFTIRSIAAAQAAKKKGNWVNSLLEHPEDLGAMFSTPHKDIGKEPASIWQLPEIRKAFGDSTHWCVGGHQCQYPGVDRRKPTRLLSDLVGVADFGIDKWPSFDQAGYYVGPLPKDCGHKHKQAMIGRVKKKD